MRTARTLMSNVEAVEATKQLRNTRRSGLRIDTVPLIEYQMSPFAAAPRYTLARRQSLGSSLWFLSLSSTIRISLAAMIFQAR
jgi:hypothetical protein